MEIEETDYEAYLRGDEYYLTEWESIRENGYSRFNWKAFLFGLVWMLTRKMYLVVFIIFGLLLVEYILEETIIDYLALNELKAAIFSLAINIINVLLIGTFANKLYMWEANRKIRNIQKRNLPEEEYYAELYKKGGITLIPLIIIAALILGTMLYFTLQNN